MASPSTTLLMDTTEMASAIEGLATEIQSSPRCKLHPLVLIGIHKRGVPLAQRLAAAIQRITGKTIPVGTLDITQHRDDLSSLSDLPNLLGSDIPFAIDETRVVLCDEVIYTGRSIRAALGELLDFGRPACVELAALVDRGGREFPIQPDYKAQQVSISASERVSVRFTEVDGEDAVLIEPNPSIPL